VGVIDLLFYFCLCFSPCCVNSSVARPRDCLLKPFPRQAVIYSQAGTVVMRLYVQANYTFQANGKLKKYID